MTLSDGDNGNAHVTVTYFLSKKSQLLTPFTPPEKQKEENRLISLLYPNIEKNIQKKKHFTAAETCRKKENVQVEKHIFSFLLYLK